MATGEVYIETFKTVGGAIGVLPTVDIPLSTIRECCFVIPVLAKNGGTNEQNDISSPLFAYNDYYATVTLVLQRFDGGVWVDLVPLVDNTYGEFFAYKFYKNHVGYRVEWDKVLNLQGEGSYRVKTVETAVTGGITNSYSFNYCLQIYTQNRANKTVRLDFWNNGTLAKHDSTGYQERFDFGHDIASNGVGWYDQIRIGGEFGEETNPERKNEYVRYTNGAQVFTEESQKAQFLFDSDKNSYPAYLHKFLKINVTQADIIHLTNYDNNATDNFVSLPVIMKGNYEPEWNKNLSKKAFLKLKFEPKFDNLHKKRC